MSNKPYGGGESGYPRNGSIPLIAKKERVGNYK
jgi:hypothetical protein